MSKNLISNRHQEERKSFLFYGIINFLITNLILQIMLLLFETYIATLISQVANTIIGFYLYGKKVFKYKNYTKLTGIKYFLLSLSTWVINWTGIEFITTFTINKNISAIIIIPLLVIISYIFQKQFVFRK